MVAAASEFVLYFLCVYPVPYIISLANNSVRLMSRNRGDHGLVCITGAPLIVISVRVFNAEK